MRNFTLLVVGLIAGLTGTAIGAEMSITQGNSTAVIRIGDEVVGTYRYGKDQAKPYLIAVSAPGALDLLISELNEPVADGASPGSAGPGNKVFVAVEQAELRTAPDGESAGTATFGEIHDIVAAKDQWLKLNGDSDRWIAARNIVPIKAMVTRLVNLNPQPIKDRAHPDYYDHPHHKGVWNAVDEVNGIKFWAEAGRIENASVEVLKGAGDPVQLKVVNHWLGTDGKPLLEEQAVITIGSDRLFAYDITFTAVDQTATFDDTKEGMFAIRMPNSMREQFAKGPVVNAEGQVGSKASWGRPSAWIDYVGPIGNHNFGVAIMDHPDNPRKSRYHVRDYGLFAISPFGEGSYSRGTPEAVPANPLTLQPGESVRFRYGLYLHIGDAETGKVAEAFARFVENSR